MFQSFILMNSYCRPHLDRYVVNFAKVVRVAMRTHAVNRQNQPFPIVCLLEYSKAAT